MEGKFNRPQIIKNSDGLFQLIDDESQTLQTKTAQRGLKRFDPYFHDSGRMVFKPDLTYVQLLDLIDKLNHKLERKGLPIIETDNEFNKFVEEKQYFIKEQSEAGITIKNNDSRWQD